MPYNPYAELAAIQELGARSVRPIREYVQGREDDDRRLQDALTIQGVRDDAALERAYVASEGQARSLDAYAERIALKEDAQASAALQASGIARKPNETHAEHVARGVGERNKQFGVRFQSAVENFNRLEGEIEKDAQERRAALEAKADSLAAAAAMDIVNSNTDLKDDLAKGGDKFVDENGDPNMDEIIRHMRTNKDYRGLITEVQSVMSATKTYAMADLASDSRYSLQNQKTLDLYRQRDANQRVMNVILDANPNAALNADMSKGRVVNPAIGQGTGQGQGQGTADLRALAKTGGGAKKPAAASKPAIEGASPGFQSAAADIIGIQPGRATRSMELMTRGPSALIPGGRPMRDAIGSGISAIIGARRGAQQQAAPRPVPLTPEEAAMLNAISQQTNRPVANPASTNRITEQDILDEILGIQ